MGTVHRAISKSLIIFIRGYQYFMAPLLGECCRFYPSCSNYSIKALKQHGTFLGLYFAIRRILRCHPWCEGGYDPLPKEME